MAATKSGITQLISKYQNGDRAALEELVPLVHDRLKRIAANHMKRIGQGHTLAPTALVNEAFIKMIESKDLVLNDRNHFFAVAARAMRFILADYARAKFAERRGGGQCRVSFDEALHVGKSDDLPIDVVPLNSALERLTRQDPRLAQVVELRFLAGLSIEETAAVMGSSPATVKRDWKVARAWLQRELSEDEAA